jgi:SAM-dependent methyltransferase
MIVVDPDPLVVQIANTLKPGRALDLACGAGRNALWLASNGWNVEAIDNSPAALSAIPRAPNLCTQLADLEKPDYRIEPESWELILMVRYLQRDLWEPAKRGLTPGGAIIVIVLLEDPNKQGRSRALPSELRHAFEDFEILDYSEADGLAKLAARKPY